MGIKTGNALAMVNNDHVAVNAEVVGKNHLAAIGCSHFGLFGRGDVNTQVGLIVDGLPAVEITALIGISSAACPRHAEKPV